MAKKKENTDWQIAELEKQLKKVYEDRDSISDQIEKLKSAKELPGLKKKYEGKFFRYNNGYNATNRWWIYVHVVEVKARGHFLIARFETTTDGKSEFGTYKEYSTSLMQSPITKRQYYSALNNFKKQLNTI